MRTWPFSYKLMWIVWGSFSLLYRNLLSTTKLDSRFFSSHVNEKSPSPVNSSSLNLNILSSVFLLCLGSDTVNLQEREREREVHVTRWERRQAGVARIQVTQNMWQGGSVLWEVVRWMTEVWILVANGGIHLLKSVISSSFVRLCAFSLFGLGVWISCSQFVLRIKSAFIPDYPDLVVTQNPPHCVR